MVLLLGYESGLSIRVPNTSTPDVDIFDRELPWIPLDNSAFELRVDDGCRRYEITATRIEAALKLLEGCQAALSAFWAVQVKHYEGSLKAGRPHAHTQSEPFTANDVLIGRIQQLIDEATEMGKVFRLERVIVTDEEESA
jgi:hypothetical protein